MVHAVRPRVALTRRLVPVGIPLVLVLAAGCSLPVPMERASTADDPLLRETSATSRWSYRGLMPTLDDVRLTVSLSGHTVRADGLLPLGAASALPFYAITEPAPNARTRVHVVYPIATVDADGVTAEGAPTRNPEPFTYETCGGEMRHDSNELGAFGGFPFIEYVCDHTDRDGRRRSGIAFHGPITATTFEGTPYWSLLRGPVSHACNRMLGEHVLELAHVIGFDRGKRGTPVRVIAELDSWHGRKVDVDYPSTGWARPAANASFVFPTWQAVLRAGNSSVKIAFPRWACETERCASMPPNAADESTGGLARGVVECPPAYHLEAVGAQGGSICVSDTGRDAWGPYTREMVSVCKGNGGGSVCDSDRWASQFAKDIRGGGVCPIGARYDALTGYCQEGDDAFGPFPRALLNRCVQAGGGEAACRSARWSRFFLASLLGRI